MKITTSVFNGFNYGMFNVSCIKCIRIDTFLTRREEKGREKSNDFIEVDHSLEKVERKIMPMRVHCVHS